MGKDAKAVSFTQDTEIPLVLTQLEGNMGETGATAVCRADLSGLDIVDLDEINRIS